MEERKLKSGESRTHFCRKCNTLMYEDEEYETVCENCKIDNLHKNMSKYLKQKIKKYGTLQAYLETKWTEE